MHTHVFSIRGKHEDITDDDLKEFAIRNDIKNPAIHLYATVDGRQRRRVITPKNASHQSLLSAAKSQLSEDGQKKIIELYFK